MRHSGCHVPGDQPVEHERRDSSGGLSMTVSSTPTAAGPGEAPQLVRLALFVAACGSVLPLLAWVYGLGSFASFALVVGAPLVLAVFGTTVWLDRTGRWPKTRAAILAGAIGGLVGTLGYDLFRVPFVYTTGLQLLAPIESYGVLLLDAPSSSTLTAFAGWAYHFVNGIGFGIAWAVVARGRPWLWGVGWAMFLETMTIISPFAGTYGLIAGGQVQVLPIAIAYAAHVPYGVAVGLFAQHADARAVEARSLLRAPVALLVGVLAVVLVLWHRPFIADPADARGEAVAAGPSVVILDGRLHPTWTRLPVGGCVTVENGQAAAVVLGTGTSLDPGARTEVCAPDAGVHRLRVEDVPFSGGWLIVDPAVRP